MQKQRHKENYERKKNTEDGYLYRLTLNVSESVSKKKKKRVELCHLYFITFIINIITIDQ